MGGTWVLEQPRGSMVSWHPRIRELWRSFPKVRREALTKDHAIRPCQSHVSKSGKKVYQGTKFLKITGSKPETYPPKFGDRVSDLHEKFCSERTHLPTLPAELLQEELVAFFRGKTWGDLWDDANMYHCLRYLRGCTRLCLSDAWRAVFPSKLV
ncbi:unnamed protein product [Durusdinium trenchii]|uniref:Uncharacterized protein n=1 Tax=Durusdinium trenchii TaxID=1381693 RepID=A0ABP0N2U4_9DINO